MALNKYDKFVNKDWSWQTMVPKLPEFDAAGFDEVLKQQQTQIDQVGLLSDKRPNVLNNQPDLELYQNYQKDVNTALDTVSKEYGKGITAGNMAYKNYLNQFRKDWSPGGRADILNKRNEAYQSGVKAIDEFYKDDSSPVNKTLAKRQLQEQLKNPIDVDPSTGQFTNFSQPELYKNPEINKAIDEMLKEIKANGDTTFLGDMNKSWWIQKIQSETREPERIKLAYQALSQQPEYASQINRDAQYKALGVDPIKYKADFEAKQKGSIEQLDKEAARISDRGTKQEIIDWQNQLRAEGFNVKPDGDFGPLTEKATKEFLDKQKKAVQDNISGFDLNNQLRGEVDKSYLGYALRGAYKKTEVEPIYNRVKEAQMDFSLKKEANSIALWSAQQQWAPKPGPNATVVSGVAGQLPVINDYYMEQKNLAKKTEADLNKAISSTDTFRGWDLKNVAEAYNVWDKVRGNTEAEKKANYKQLLIDNSNGFQYTDQQVEALYQEMNGIGMGPIKSSLKTLGDIQAEVYRVEEGQGQIADQYIKTSEGKEQLKLLREQSPTGLKGLSDAELVRKALSEPELFDYSVQSTGVSGVGMGGSIPKSTTYNAAKTFKTISDRQIAKQQREGVNYDWGSLGTTELYVNNKDEVLKPTLDGISDAILTGTNKNFKTFGKIGIEYRNKNGEKVDEGNTRKVETMAVTINERRQPVLRVGVTITPPTGKPYLAYTDLDVTPGSAEAYQLKQGLEKEYANAVNAGLTPAAEGILDNINALQGNDNIKYAAADNKLKHLNTNNTTPQKIYQEKRNPDGSKTLVDVSELGWLATDFQMNDNVAGYGYQLYGFSTPTGNGVGNVFTDAQGNMILSEDISGKSIYNSTAPAKQALLGKEILSRTPIEVTQQKVHTPGMTERRSSTTVEYNKTTKQ